MLGNQHLRDAGLKVTVPRMKILEILQEAPEHHLSAEEVYHLLVDAGNDVGLATVYRVLAQFEAAGLVTRQNFEGGHSVFELNQGEHHDHLVCVACGKVLEFVDDAIEARQEIIAKNANFTITAHALTIYGHCPECQKRST
jgi:Fur family ferric uptake transcriptional regulator